MRALLFILGLLAAVPAHAQPKLLQAHAAAVSGYTGAGDIVSGAKVAYALRAYNAAYAVSGTGKSINVRRASDNSTQDIVILTSGALDLASYNTFVGTDATASCTIAGTSAVCTGASATINVHDVVTGVGISQPCVVTATNGSTTATVVLAGLGTTCGTVSVAETVTFQVAGYVTKAYDQSGALNCSAAACDASQGTAANQPQLLPACTANGAPCMFFDKSLPSVIASAGQSSTGPLSYNYEGARVAAFTTAQFVFNCGNGGNPLYYTASANTMIMNNGTNNLTKTASDGVVHNVQGVGGSGTSGSITVDGSSSAGGNGGTGSCTAQAWAIGATSTAASPSTTYVSEVEAYALQFSGGNISSLRTNMSAFWGSP